MQIHHMGYGIKGFYKLAKLGQLWDMIPKEAQYRLRVLRFWKKYGLEATRGAFGVSDAPFIGGRPSFELPGGIPQPSYLMSPSPEGNVNPIGQRK